MTKIVEEIKAILNAASREEIMLDAADYNDKESDECRMWFELFQKTNVEKKEIFRKLKQLNDRTVFCVRACTRGKIDTMHVTRTGTKWRQPLAILYRIGEDGDMKEYYWYFDGHKNQFVWAVDFRLGPVQEVSLLPFASFEDFLVQLGCSNFAFLTAYKHEVPVFMGRAAESAEKIIDSQ